MGNEMTAEISGLDLASITRQSRQTTQAVVHGLLQIFDMSLIFVTGLLVYFSYVYSGQGQLSSKYVVPIVAGALVTGIISHFINVYSGESVFSKRAPIRRILSAWALTFAMLLVAAFALKITSYYSRVWAVTWFFASAGFLMGGRLLIHQWMYHWAHEGPFAFRTVIIGASEQGQALVSYLNEHGDAFTRVIGFIDDRSSRIPRSSEGYEVLGNIDHLTTLIRSDMVDQVLVALPGSAIDRVNQVIDQLLLTPVRIFLAPQLINLKLRKGAYAQIAGIPMLEVADRPISGWSHLLKALEDRLLAAFFIVLTGPLMLLIAIAIKLDSPGSVFFRQPRYGFNDGLIGVWKFRSMYTDLTDENCEVQTTRNDPRITRVGGFLRRSSMDELPQFFNVLAGNMSIVGPRPHAVETKAAGARFVEVVRNYAARHRVKPGITGWAQVSGWRGETDTIEKIEKRVEHDLYYIDNWTIWFDIKIIFKTIFVLVMDKRAY